MNESMRTGHTSRSFVLHMAGCLALMLALLLGGGACAQQASSLTITDGVVTAFDGTADEVIIPEGVTHIGEYAFYGYPDLRRVVLPSTLQEIGSCAFGGCTGLTALELPEGVAAIGRSAFYNCSALETVVFASGLRSIGDQAFAHCVSLTELMLPDGLESIGLGAFAGCTALEMAELPQSLSFIDDHAFPVRGDLLMMAGDNLYAQEYCELNGLSCIPAEYREYVRAWRDGRLTYQIDEASVEWLWITDAKASTTHKSSSRGSYEAFNAIDLDDSTSWQFDMSSVSSLRDAYLELYLRESSAVCGVPIKQGFWTVTSGLDQYTRNGRPTRVEISFRYDGETSFTDPVEADIPDDRSSGDFYHIRFDWRYHVNAVRIRVLKVARGSQFPDDVAVSEVRLSGVPMDEAPLVIIPESMEE